MSAGLKRDIEDRHAALFIPRSDCKKEQRAGKQQGARLNLVNRALQVIEALSPGDAIVAHANSFNP